MSTVTAEIRFAPQTAQWFTDNASLVLASGELAYRSSDGKYKLGDGSTALSSLTFYGGVGGTGDALTTNPLSQFASTTSAQLAGVISDETGSGALVFGTSPTFTTQIISPIVYGSDSSGGNLLIDSTSHATKGQINIGGNLLCGKWPTSTAYFYIAHSSATISTGYSLISNGTNTILNASGICYISRADGNQLALSASALTVTTVKIILAAGTTSIASLNIPSGVAPSSPVNGDLWSDGSDLKVRLGGTTYTLSKV